MSLKPLLGVALALVSVSPSTGAPTHPPRPDPCVLGAQIVAEQVAEGGAVFDGADARVGVLFEAGRGRLPATIQAAIARRPPVNLFQACPTLADHLPPGARMATPQDLLDASSASKRADVYITVLSAPVFDRQGGAAAVSTHSYCAGLCGYGGLYLYSAKAGRWTRGEPLVSMVS